MLGTLFNMPDRTKDGPKARNDLMDMNIRKGLHLPSARDDDEDEEETQGPSKRKRVKPNEWYCPPSCFTLSPNELDRVFQCFLGVRVPNGYSGLISRYLDLIKKKSSAG